MFNIFANTNLILWETERAFLLAFPKTKYRFWISKKLVRVYENKIAFIIPDDFSVRIFKNGQGKWNKRDVIDERVIDHVEFLKQFGMDLDNSIIEDLKDD